MLTESPVRKPISLRTEASGSTCQPYEWARLEVNSPAPLNNPKLMLEGQRQDVLAKSCPNGILVNKNKQVLGYATPLRSSLLHSSRLWTTRQHYIPQIITWFSQMKACSYQPTASHVSWSTPLFVWFTKATEVRNKHTQPGSWKLSLLLY